jgi:hypothetical protein
MTAKDSLDFIRMLLDDSRDWFPTLNLILATINTAQRRKLQHYYDKQDERALRPFYKETAWIQSPTLITDILYPRTCKMKFSPNDADNLSHVITHLDSELYFNYNQRGDATGMTYPRNAVYTIYWDSIANISGKYFIATNSTVNDRYKLWYIQEPNVFNYAPNPGFGNLSIGVPLQFPSEYHPEILSLAAEMLNDIDVGEMQRGEISENKLTLESVGGA